MCASSVFDLALDLTSHSPAWCWGKKQWTKWIFVRLNCSHNPSTWNLTCNARELRLMPACPLVKVRRMDDIRRRLWLPSRPATDPDNDVIGPRLVRKRSEIDDLLDSYKIRKIKIKTRFRFQTGHVGIKKKSLKILLIRNSNKDCSRV